FEDAPSDVLSYRALRAGAAAVRREPPRSPPGRPKVALDTALFGMYGGRPGSDLDGSPLRSISDRTAGFGRARRAREPRARSVSQEQAKHESNTGISETRFSHAARPGLFEQHHSLDWGRAQSQLQSRGSDRERTARSDHTCRAFQRRFRTRLQLQSGPRGPVPGGRSEIARGAGVPR